MSIPGATPNPYQQPHPSAPPGPNPYAQPYLPQQPGQPPMQGAGGYGPGPGAPPPSPPGGGRGWVWGFAGAVVASAVWAGVMFATGALGADEEDSKPLADLAGYHFHSDMCAVAELKAFQTEYEKLDPVDGDYRFSSKSDALDDSYCSLSLKSPGASEYESTSVSVRAKLHKMSDPTGEFAAGWKAYEQQDDTIKGTHYTVEPVNGFGDEAFLLTETRGSDEELAAVTLAVRDGWVTYEMAWNNYFASGPEENDSKKFTKAEITSMLKKDSRAVLAKLKQRDTSAPDRHIDG